ncbi:hypothetical protein [Acinetobacter pullicarnis]|nr:hypothetical protein [Acinetobacter pullicarnis]
MLFIFHYAWSDFTTQNQREPNAVDTLAVFDLNIGVCGGDTVPRLSI